MKLGLIGCGKMGKAFLRGALDSGVIASESTFVCSRRPGAAADLTREYGVRETQSILELMDKCNTILVAVKPHDAPAVLRTLTMGGGEYHLIISVVAGLTISVLRELTHPRARVVRVMPNTPAMVGKGASGYCLSDNITPAEEKAVQGLMLATGYAVKVEESLMNAVTGVSGSGPAYMMTILESMADAGVLLGLSREVSIKLAAQTMYGAAAMVLETGMHPAVLRDQVTSPGGTTIQGLAKLEKYGVRHAMMEAVKASAAKAAILGEIASSITKKGQE